VSRRRPCAERSILRGRRVATQLPVDTTTPHGVSLTSNHVVTHRREIAMKPAFDPYIAVPAERVWNALTDPAVTERYFYGSRVQSRFEKGDAIDYSAGGMKVVE